MKIWRLDEVLQLTGGGGLVVDHRAPGTGHLIQMKTDHKLIARVWTEVPDRYVLLDAVMGNKAYSEALTYQDLTSLA